MKKINFKRRIIPYSPELKANARELRNNSTLGEILLWKQLRNKQICGYDFHRQKPLLNYIVDFYCTELNLVIEIDGQSHDFEEVIKNDARRQSVLEEYDLHFIRFRESEIRHDVGDAVWVIEKYIEEFEKKSAEKVELVAKDTPPAPLQRGGRRTKIKKSL